ncbi:hypothetical protein HELRODRAFT_105068 [Helobdella robusta]|uniref:C2H2-type domain-containing protein n=1 Tax=Helobdella robusta TaxID=6412 RepID=T1EDQ4_HELRO|nr:hypothetical protein HELRODRAFT_105068 [Helobdella robusta]ESO07058.1 hypothetical protein HELRODRAFT_105068 [Helobdella robusta]
MPVMEVYVDMMPRDVNDDDVFNIKDEIQEIIILSDEEDNKSISDTQITIPNLQTNQKPPSSPINSNKISTVLLPDGRKLVQLNTLPLNRKPPIVLTSLSLNSTHRKWPVSLIPSASAHKKMPSPLALNLTPNKALHSSLMFNSTRRKGKNSLIVSVSDLQKTSNSLAFNPNSSNAMFKSVKLKSVHRKKVNLVISPRLVPKKIPNLPKIKPAPINVVPKSLTVNSTRRVMSVPQKTPNPLVHNSIPKSAKTLIITPLPSSPKIPDPPTFGSTFQKELTSQINFCSNPNNPTSQETAPSTLNKTTVPPVNMGNIVYDGVGDGEVEPESETDDGAFDDDYAEFLEEPTEIEKTDDDNPPSLGIDEEVRVFNQLIIDEESTHADQDSTSGEKAEVETKKFVCTFCQKPLPTKKAYLEHVQLHIIDKLYNCKVCKKSFNMISKLLEHEKEHKEKHVCSICYLTFDVFDEFQKHSDRHKFDEKPTCNICKKLCKTFSQLRKHTKKHASNKPYVCPICEKSFRNAVHLQLHHNCHKLRSPIVCSICSKVFYNRPPYNHHMKKHKLTGKKRIEVKINPAEKSKPQRNINKKDEKHNDNADDGEKNDREKDKVLKCQFCDKTYNKQSSLKSHMSCKHWNGHTTLPPNFNLEKLTKAHVFSQKKDTPTVQR